MTRRKCKEGKQGPCLRPLWRAVTSVTVDQTQRADSMKGQAFVRVSPVAHQSHWVSAFTPARVEGMTTQKIDLQRTEVCAPKHNGRRSSHSHVCASEIVDRGWNNSGQFFSGRAEMPRTSLAQTAYFPAAPAGCAHNLNRRLSRKGSAVRLRSIGSQCRALRDDRGVGDRAPRRAGPGARRRDPAAGEAVPRLGTVAATPTCPSRDRQGDGQAGAPLHSILATPPSIPSTCRRLALQDGRDPGR